MKCVYTEDFIYRSKSASPAVQTDHIYNIFYKNQIGKKWGFVVTMRPSQCFFAANKIGSISTFHNNLIKI